MPNLRRGEPIPEDEEDEGDNAWDEAVVLPSVSRKLSRNTSLPPSSQQAAQPLVQASAFSSFASRGLEESVEAAGGGSAFAGRAQVQVEAEGDGGRLGRVAPSVSFSRPRRGLFRSATSISESSVRDASSSELPRELSSSEGQRELSSSESRRETGDMPGIIENLSPVGHDGAHESAFSNAWTTDGGANAGMVVECILKRMRMVVRFTVRR